MNVIKFQIVFHDEKQNRAIHVHREDFPLTLVGLAKALDECDRLNEEKDLSKPEAERLGENAAYFWVLAVFADGSRQSVSNIYQWNQTIPFGDLLEAERIAQKQRDEYRGHGRIPHVLWITPITGARKEKA